MSAIAERLNENALRIGQELTVRLQIGDSKYPVLAQAMRYSAESGGKRIRPTLTLEVCRMLGGADEDAIPLACAIEMIHTYSLIHDDLPCMDDDTERRGKPTNHVVFGEANALLAGDGLLTFAFETAVSGRLAPRLQVEAVRLLAQMAGPLGMVGGQVIDLIGDRERLDLATLTRMENMKTGCLIRCACLLGALAAGYSIEDSDPEAKARTDALIRYASGIGLAFQIEDDILDAGEESEKTTFLTFLQIEEARERVRELTEDAVAALEPFANKDILTDLAYYLAGRDK